MNPVFKKLKSALEMALQLRLLAMTLIVAFVGTFWNLGVIFYMGGGDIGFVAYLVLISVPVILFYLYLIVLVFIDPSKLSSFKAIKISWRDVYQIWKD